MAKSFDDLPFNARPDLTPYLIHLTRRSVSGTKRYSGYQNLRRILKSGTIWGSGSKGFVRGRNSAACFMDVPLASLKYVLTPENTDPEKPRYEPYGILVTKPTAYRKGCRPVLYLSADELDDLSIPKNELWRVVRFEVRADDDWVSWLHEREWRCKGDFDLPESPLVAFVKNSNEAEDLMTELVEHPDRFQSRPRAVVPLSVLCQGFLPK